MHRSYTVGIFWASWSSNCCWGGAYPYPWAIATITQADKTKNWWMILCYNESPLMRSLNSQNHNAYSYLKLFGYSGHWWIHQASLCRGTQNWLWLLWTITPDTKSMWVTWSYIVLGLAIEIMKAAALHCINALSMSPHAYFFLQRCSQAFHAVMRHLPSSCKYPEYIRS